MNKYVTPCRKKITCKLPLVAFIGLLMLQGQAVFSQSDQSSKYSFDFHSVVPGMPENASLGSYGGTPVSTATGLPDISFNLYTVNYGGMSVPVRMAYDASGIKYSDIPSALGMKWSLEAGGSISRSINGIPDENYLLLYPYVLDSAFIEYETMHPDRADAQDSCSHIAKNDYDCTLDYYFYSFPGHSGSMYMGPAGKFYPDKEYTKVKISYTNHLDTFAIRDEMGNIYQYAAINDVSNTFINGKLSASSKSFNARVSWKLTRIITATKKRIDFEYVPYYYEYISLNSERYTTYNSSGSEGLCELAGSVSDDAYQTTTFHNTAQLLSKIKTDIEEVSFQYVDDSTRPIWIKQLRGMKVVSKISGDTIRRVRFNHSGDYLESYEEQDTLSHAVKKYSFVYNGTSPLDPYSKNRDIFGYYNGSSNSTLIANPAVNDNGYPFSLADREPDGDAASEGTLTEITWPTGGNTKFEYEYKQDSLGAELYYGPGLRIKSIADYDVDNKVYNMKRFHYTPQEALQLINLIGVSEDATTFNFHVTNVFLSENPTIKNIGDFFYRDVVTENVSAGGSTWSRDHYSEQYGIYDKAAPMLTRRDIYKDDTLHLLKTTTYQYQMTPVDSVRIYSYNMLKPYDFSGSYYYEGSTFVHQYCGVNVYRGFEVDSKIFPRIYTLAHQTDTDYSSLPAKVQEQVNTYYSNPVFLKTAATTDSKGRRQSTLYEYPFNFPSDTTLQRMVDSNWISPLVTQTDSVAGTALFQKKNDYGFNGSGFFTLNNVHLYNLKLGGEQLYHYYAYDSSGNVLEQGKHNDIHESYIWDYKNTLPVAKVVNASNANIAYTSFETDGGGNWTIGSSLRDNTNAITGTNSYNLSNGNLSKNGLVTYNLYRITYWSTNGAKTLSGCTGTSRTGRTINGWTYYEHTVSAISSTITISGSGSIDELRLYPLDAQMTTYTYRPLIGLSSTADANGEISYYEYDSFNRLKFIRDFKGDIIKNFQYNYSH